VTLFILPALSSIMKVSVAVLLPLTRVIKFLFPNANLVPVGRLTSLSLEEISGLISEANITGTLARDTSMMLEGVLRFGQLNVSQIMTPADRMEAVNIDQDEDKFLEPVR